ncbi:macro domain-containing protein PG1779-like isoform X1 [Bolinopsis microptera]|uniref:macro domain-containing protein PG1779-like isoform X1 n=1 Tax=Bolinopsis microptera TaxID=2820187 RepID=UPI00307ADBDE
MGVGDGNEKRRTLKSVCGKCESEVMHWVHYAAAGEIPSFPPGLDDAVPDFKVNKRIFIHDGSISELECDVITLSCSKSIAPTGMKAVYYQAGPELSRTARQLGPKQVTELVETEGFELPSYNVFHIVVPPTCHTTTEFEQLEQCYLNILNTLVKHGYKSIAMPCLGSGATTQTLKDSCVNVQLRTLRRWMDTIVDGIPNAKRVTTIILCRWIDRDINALDRLLHKWFPTDPPKVTQLKKTTTNKKKKK